jgi:hypothetical protein
VTVVALLIFVHVAQPCICIDRHSITASPCISHKHIRTSSTHTQTHSHTVDPNGSTLLARVTRTQVKQRCVYYRWQHRADPRHDPNGLGWLGRRHLCRQSVIGTALCMPCDFASIHFMLARHVHTQRQAVTPSPVSRRTSCNSGIWPHRRHHGDVDSAVDALKRATWFVIKRPTGTS